MDPRRSLSSAIVLSHISPETGTAIGTLALAVATVLLAVVAVFAEPLRRRFSHTRLVATIRVAPPDTHQIEVRTPTGASIGNAVYSRIRVENVGDAAAENVEVLVSRVAAVDAGKETEVTWFLPMSLVWSHFPTSEQHDSHSERC